MLFIYLLLIIIFFRKRAEIKITVSNLSRRFLINFLFYAWNNHKSLSLSIKTNFTTEQAANNYTYPSDKWETPSSWVLLVIFFASSFTTCSWVEKSNFSFLSPARDWRKTWPHVPAANTQGYQAAALSRATTHPRQIEFSTYTMEG